MKGLTISQTVPSAKGISIPGEEMRLRNKTLMEINSPTKLEWRKSGFPPTGGFLGSLYAAQRGRMQSPSTNGRRMTWLTKPVLGHLGSGGPCFPRSQRETASSWGELVICLSGGSQSLPQGSSKQAHFTSRISSKGSLEWVPAWLRQESCVHSLGKSPFVWAPCWRQEFAVQIPNP